MKRSDQRIENNTAPTQQQRILNNASSEMLGIMIPLSLLDTRCFIYIDIGSEISLENTLFKLNHNDAHIAARRRNYWHGKHGKVALHCIEGLCTYVLPFMKLDCDKLRPFNPDGIGWRRKGLYDTNKLVWQVILMRTLSFKPAHGIILLQHYAEWRPFYHYPWRTAVCILV